jgi:hypothetical protein
MVAILSPLGLYGGNKSLKYPYKLIRDTCPSMAKPKLFVIAPSDGCPATSNLLSLDTSLTIPTRVLHFEVSGLRHRTPVRPVPTGQTGTHRSDRSVGAASLSSVFRSWLCGSTKEPNGFLVNHRKPCELSVASANRHS